MIDLASMRVVKFLMRDRGSNDNLEPLSRQREKGLWNFLTWSFFISQVLVAEQVFGAPARLGGVLDDGLMGGRGDGEQGVLGSLAGPEAIVHADTSLPGGVDAAYPVAPASDGLPIMLAGVPVDQGVAAHIGANEGPLNHAGAYQSSGMVIAEVAGNYGSGGNSDALPPGGTMGVLDPILPPVIGVVEDILDPILDQLPPVLGVVADVLDPIVDQLPPILGAVGNVVETVTTHIVAPLEPVLGVVTDLAAPVTSLLGLHSSAPISLTSGSLDFDHVISLPGGLLNDLFSGGQYTNYNLALQSDDTEPTHSSPSIVSGSNLLSLVEHIVGAGGESHDSHSDHGQAQTISLPSLLDDIALRGLGDGIAV